MSKKYRPKAGDWVRLTVEGEVTYAAGAEVEIDKGYVNASLDRPGVSVERLIDPLPVVVGSVIRYHGVSYARTMSGEWRSLLLGGGLYDAHEFDDANDVVVLFDAGKVES